MAFFGRKLKEKKNEISDKFSLIVEFNNAINLLRETALLGVSERLRVVVAVNVKFYDIKKMIRFNKKNETIEERKKERKKERKQNEKYK